MIRVVGVGSSYFAAGVEAADVVVGSERLLAAVDPSIRADATTVVLTGDLAAALDAVAQAVSARREVCVVASGDPGWFGVVRPLASRFGRECLSVHPAPSAVSEAFARLSMPWDDATVVSAHGRPLGDAARLAARAPKAAVLTSPDAPPQALGALLAELGASHEHVAVCSHLGSAHECVSITDLTGLARGEWDAMAVVVLWSGEGVAGAKSLGWGLPESAWSHRQSMVTKSEVRAIVLGLLCLPAPAVPTPVMWDVGAGTGSVAIESLRVAPWMDAIAIDHDADAIVRCQQNAQAHGVGLRALVGSAPNCLANLPDPDRVFVGGGGIEVLTHARARLRPGGVVVATHAAMDRAVEAARILGNLTQVTASRGKQLPDGGWRLEATNPVFVTWGGPE